MTNESEANCKCPADYTGDRCEGTYVALHVPSLGIYYVLILDMCY